MKSTTENKGRELDLALSASRSAYALEKWYIDVLLGDGTVILVYLGRLRLFGLCWARATAEVFFPDGGIARFSEKVRDLDIAGSRGKLRFGRTEIDGDALRISIGSLRGELHYRACGSSIVPRDPWLIEGSHRLSWRVEIPDSAVDGELSWPEGALSIQAGRGYRDRVFFDLPPWSFPIRRLVWGRCVAGEHTSVWLSAQLNSQTGTLHEAWVNGTPVHPSEDSLPAGVTLGAPRTLLDARVTELESLRLGAGRALLRVLTGDPHEIKMAAPCSVSGVPGCAVHEVVTWTPR